MNAIQKLMALHPEARISIRGDRTQSGLVYVMIEGTIHDGITDKEPYTLSSQVNIKMESLTDKIKVDVEHSLERLEGCRCKVPGEDDGTNTCWKHHDCRTGDCTHGE